MPDQAESFRSFDVRGAAAGDTNPSLELLPWFFGTEVEMSKHSRDRWDRKTKPPPSDTLTLQVAVLAEIFQVRTTSG